MKIKSIHLQNFKRFTDLRIQNIPETAKLVVMIGPNGSGKSSVFDALLRIKFTKGLVNISSPDSYLIKFDLSEQTYVEPKVEFYTESQITEHAWSKSIHVRSAYRNDAMDTSYRFLSQTKSLTKELRFRRLSENDQAVASNYDRILDPWIERTSVRKESGETVDEIEDDLYGDLRDVISKLFRDPQLTLIGLGSPKKGCIFKFNKGTSHGFSYENLSSGEKAALDIILDIIVAKAEFDDTVFCIDEPEAHMHTKLQGRLLEELYNLIPENSQLWIATHSVGMVRKAQDLWRDNPDSVVFLDFGNRNFDEEVIIAPAEPKPSFWTQIYDVVLGDLAELVVTGQTVFCEGEEFDEECYRKIFKDTYPDVCFVSLGARSNVEKSVTAANLAIEKIAEKAKVIGIVDRDKATDDEIKRNEKNGIRTLSKTTIESYLLDDEVLTKLCEDHDASEKVEDLLAVKQNALDKNKIESSDNLKSIVQPIHGAAQEILKSANLGNDKESFMMDVLAPLIQPGMEVYKELHKDIFGE